jgi:hypothetical protein
MAENTKITISEFKAWLEGITDLQGEEWSPNPEQWKKIKSKLFSIEGFDLPVERQITIIVERALGKVRWQNFVPPAAQPQQLWQPPVQPIDANGVPIQPAQPASLPPIIPPTSSSLGGIGAPPSGTPIPGVPGAAQGNLDPNKAIRIEPAKTPDIDTSGGGYKATQFL